ncbi:MAG: hypothetical protein KC416_11780 [Myxococcales bacterium]|nr:hypothetical protein [Myxococcales bacterium]
MMARTPALDLLRSTLRTVADRAVSRVQQSPVGQTVAKAIDDLRHQRSRVSESQLTSAVAHVPGVESATVTARDGVLRTDVSFQDGTTLAFAASPTRVTFAPRGAKELTFRLEGPSPPTDHRVGDLMGAIAGEIANRLCSFAPQAPATGPAVTVDRDGAILRIDLRTTRIGRELKGSPLEMVMEVLQLRSVSVRDHHIYLDVHIPRI